MIKPGPRVCPVIVRGAGGDVQQRGGFVDGQPGEIAEFYQFRFNRILCGELIERVIDRQELIVCIR